MKQIFLIIFFTHFTFAVFSQTLNQTSVQKNSIKISPTVNFDWSKSLKFKHNSTNVVTGLNINYQREDKLKNYHDVGFLIGFIPVTKKSNSYSGKQLGVEYNYKLVFAKFKNNSLQIYTATGTQLIYRKLQSADLKIPNFTSNSFIQNFSISPGFQYSKNNFFFDFSLPTSIGYNIQKQHYLYPDFDTSQDETSVKNNLQKNILLNWNVGVKAGIGAKF